MLNGHLDTEPVAPDYRTQGIDPFSGEVRDGWLFGLGSVNMKSALAAFLGALDALRRSGDGLCGEVVAACVAGEIQGGLGSRLLLESGLMRPDMVIVGEETDLAVVTGHAGCINASITLEGRPTHMNWPEKGRSVVGALQTVLASL
ncbi:MAG: M20/M25/M40 family metallo-hydrolase, partial [Acetobacteraceae bacterium]|nr:M20/M25/M40 family metallo-hydrolase [Acetobacteraceae bacterium]